MYWSNNKTSVMTGRGPEWATAPATDGVHPGLRWKRRFLPKLSALLTTPANCTYCCAATKRNAAVYVHAGRRLSSVTTKGKRVSRSQCCLHLQSSKCCSPSFQISLTVCAWLHTEAECVTTYVDIHYGWTADLISIHRVSGEQRHTTQLISRVKK